jgi:hypothetical protein
MKTRIELWGGSSRLVKRVKVGLPLLVLCPLLLTCWTLGAARPPAQFPIDLIPSYLAGKLWLAGHFDALYHQGAWLPATGANAEWLAMAQRHRAGMGDTAFTYNPMYLAFLLPFIAVLPAVKFYWFFAIINALAALFVGWESARLTGLQKPWQRWAVTLWVALSFPCAYAAMLGQNVVIAAALVLAALRLFARDRWMFGAIVLVLACALKPWCVLVAGALALSGRWRALFAFAALNVTLLTVVPVVFLPAPIVDGYDRVLSGLPAVSVLAFNNVSLRALVRRVSTGDWRAQAWNWSRHDVVSGGELAVELLVLILVLGTYVRFVRVRRPTFDALSVEVMALALLPLGVCWSHYLVFALPVVVRTVFSREVPRGLRMVAALSCLWLWHMMSASAPILPIMRPPLLWAFVYSAPLLLPVLLCLGLARFGRDGSSRDVATSEANATWTPRTSDETYAATTTART